LAQALPERWRSDCYFSAAEHLIRAHGHGQYTAAVGLCAGAGAYTAPCLRYLQWELARAAPHADEDNVVGWAQARLAADAVGEHWAGTLLAEPMVDGYWALATGMAMQHASVLSGDMLDHVPKEARPHVRGAAATRLMSEVSDPALDLQDWADRIYGVLVQRAGKQPRATRHGQYWVPKAKWSRKAASEAGMPVIPNQGSAPRVVAEAPEIDMLLCVLEAAARLDPVPIALLEQGRSHTDPKVRWTSEQLLLVPR
jgi:hypothetical protein